MWSTTRSCWRWRVIRRRLRKPRSRKRWSRGCYRSFHAPIAMALWKRTAGVIGQKRKAEASGFKGAIDGRYGEQIMRHTGPKTGLDKRHRSEEHTSELQ